MPSGAVDTATGGDPECVKSNSGRTFFTGESVCHSDQPRDVSRETYAPNDCLIRALSFAGRWLGTARDYPQPGVR